MVIRNQAQSQCDCDCNQEPRYRAPEPVIPPIVPVVSVKSVNGYTGDVVLRTLTIGDKTYNGTDNVTINLEDFDIKNVMTWKGQLYASQIPTVDVEEGDSYFCPDLKELLVGYATGKGTFKHIPCIEYLEPYALAAESGSKIQLELTQDDTYRIRAILYDREDRIIHTSEYIDLPIESLVKDVWYDAATREIVFVLQDGREIRIPVGDLIKDLSDKLDKEIQDRKDADAAIAGAINKEIGDRTAADATLQANIDAEATARTSADDIITSNLDLETQARITGDNNLAGAINQEKVDRDAAISTAITQEIADRNTAIQVETDRAKAAEEAEKAAREAAIQAEATERTTKIAEEASQRRLQDSNLRDAIDFEIDDRMAGDANLLAKIEKEAQDRITAVAAEETARIKAVNDEATARLNADTALDQKFTAAVSEVSTSVTTERNRALKAEQDLQTQITRVEDTLENSIYNESVLRKNADDALDAKITTEKNTREAADNTLQGNINAEKTAREAADNALQGNIDAEKTRALGVEGSLASGISDEASTRSSKDTELQNAINTEGITRADKDAELKSGLDTEVATRTTQYKALDDAIKQEATDRSTAVTQEAASRGLADGELSNRINTEEAARIAGDQTLTTAITQEATAREAVNTRLTNEISDRQSADTTLQTAIDAIPTYYLTKLDDPGVYAAVYRLMNSKGERCGEDINLLKDSFLKEVKVITCTKDDEPFTGMIAGKKYLVFYFINAEAQTVVSFIAIDEMVKPYVGSDSITIKAEDNSLNLADAYKTRINSLETGLNLEITRASGKETEIAGNLATEVTRAKGVENTLNTDKLDRLLGDDYTGGNAYNLPYFFYTEANPNSVIVHAKTVTLDNAKTHSDYSLAVDGASTVNAGLMTAADKVKVDKSLDILPKVDDPTDPGFGWEYHIPYSFDAVPDAEKLNITIKTLTLDNKVTKMNFDKAVPGATTATAGLMTSADKTKLNALNFTYEDMTIEEK